jgi:hypothetical protein
MCAPPSAIVEAYRFEIELPVLRTVPEFHYWYSACGDAQFPVVYSQQFVDGGHYLGLPTPQQRYGRSNG